MPNTSACLPVSPVSVTSDECSSITLGDYAVTVQPTGTSQLDFAKVLLQNGQIHDDTFMVMDVGAVCHELSRWHRALPRVQPYYAVKCNPDPVVLQTLANLGAGFDCASPAEITQVLATGVHPSQIIYANPVKSRRAVQFARQNDVMMMTFDNEHELIKIKHTHPHAQMVLRIAVSDEKAEIPLKDKFGAEPTDSACHLLAAARRLGVDVIGVSFHVGSRAQCARAWANGVAHARRLFDVGRRLGHDMRVLNLGGGFISGDDGLCFEEAAECINEALDLHFMDEPNVHIMAEPGRFLVAKAFTFCCSVIGKADVDASHITQNPSDQGQPGAMYYLADGIHGTFRYQGYEKQKRLPTLLWPPANDRPVTCASVWGPTCDSRDCLFSQIRLPTLNEGDWVAFERRGDYWSAMYSPFNGFHRPQTHYFITKTDCKAVFPMRAIA